MNLQDQTIKALLDRGVAIPAPHTIEIDPEINIENISSTGVVIHAGCKIFGRSTFIGANAVLGYQGPVTLESCQVGPGVRLESGFFRQSVFLNNAKAGANSHFREGTIVEEHAVTGHGVGLKQTILFPFVAMGSLINFCDCLMAGGTGPGDHSEVGSGFIHFNYSPNQDKATPSLFGDVPRGVMLREKPVFLGGQGGAVGPLRVAFGNVTAAGTICRKDETGTGKLIVEQMLKGGSMPYTSGVYLNIRRVVANNINYIANLIALMRWYEYVRAMFTDPVNFPEALVRGARGKLEAGVTERIRQFEKLCDNMPRSIAIYKNKKGDSALASLVYQKEELYEKKDVLVELLHYLLKNEGGDETIRDDFLRNMEPVLYDHDREYIKVMQAIDYHDAANGTVWLRSVVDNVMDRAGDVLPSFELMGRPGEPEA